MLYPEKQRLRPITLIDIGTNQRSEYLGKKKKHSLCRAFTHAQQQKRKMAVVYRFFFSFGLHSTETEDPFQNNRACAAPPFTCQNPNPPHIWFS